MSNANNTLKRGENGGNAENIVCFFFFRLFENKSLFSLRAHNILVGFRRFLPLGYFIVVYCTYDDSNVY